MGLSDDSNGGKVEERSKKRVEFGQSTSIRLIVIRLRLVVVEYDVKEKVTMNCKGPREVVRQL
jgi:hypothetical protein